jgi:hypothetical protein
MIHKKLSISIQIEKTFHKIPCLKKWRFKKFLKKLLPMEMLLGLGNLEVLLVKNRKAKYKIFNNLM